MGYDLTAEYAVPVERFLADWFLKFRGITPPTTDRPLGQNILERLRYEKAVGMQTSVLTAIRDIECVAGGLVGLGLAGLAITLIDQYVGR